MFLFLLLGSGFDLAGTARVKGTKFWKSVPCREKNFEIRAVPEKNFWNPCRAAPCREKKFEIRAVPTENRHGSNPS